MKIQTRQTTLLFSILLFIASAAGAADMKAVLDVGGTFQVLNSSSNGLITVQSGGNVGIGTTNPGSRLQVSGNATIDNNLYVGSVIAVSDAGSYPRIELTGSGTTYKAINMNDSTSGESWQLSHRVHGEGNPFQISFFNGTNWNLCQSITTLGSVGIGTPSPQAKFNVYVASNSISGIRLTASDGPWAELLHSLSGGAYNGLVQPGDNALIFSKGTPDTGTFVLAPHANAAAGLRMTASGNIGIGTANPQAALHVAGNVILDNGWNNNIISGGIGGMASINFRDNTLGLMTFNISGSPKMAIADSGNVGIGTASPGQKLHVAGNVLLDNGGNDNKISGGIGGAGSINFRDNAVGGMTLNSTERFQFQIGGATKVVLDNAGSIGIGTTTPQAALDVNGTTRTKILSITGGADVAEPFTMSGGEIPKGAVVIIDAEKPGQLKMSDRAYDKRVAGIVSGAGGVNPGLTLSQHGTLEGGQNVALTGRVYAMADAANGPIQPGDLLTTSDTPGHAMKVTDPAQAQGAILGKAMTRLESGCGLVLVLVTLQ